MSLSWPKFLLIAVAGSLSLVMFQNCGFGGGGATSTSASSLGNVNSCAAQIVTYCTIPAIASGAQVSGTCPASWTGNCSYSCSAGIITAISNSCTPAAAAATTKTKVQNSDSSVSIYQYYNSQTQLHFYSKESSIASLEEIDSQGPAFEILPNANRAQGNPTITLLSCAAGANRFLSTSADCEGKSIVAQLGVIYAEQADDSVALYRFYQQATGDRLVTTRPDDPELGSAELEMVLGYIPTAMANPR